MFLRLLIWLALGFFAWRLLRPRKAAPRPAQPAPPAPAAAPAPARLEAMLDCAHCGLHLPASEALRDEAARAYCCGEHRSAGPRRAD
jgi:uncharacterized protein